MQEQGIDVIFGVNRGICAPLGTPAPVIEKLSKVLKQVHDDPEYRQKLEGIGSIPKYMDAAGYQAYIKEATGIYTDLAKKFGLEKVKK